MKHFYSFLLVLLPFCLSAQLVERFDGTSVTSNNLWLGDTEHFKIVEGELQLNTNSGSADRLLYIKSVSLLNNVWEGTVRSVSPGSPGNCFHFYLWCENADPDDTGDALLLRLGNNKQIDLCWKQGNYNTTPLITGRKLFEKGNQEVSFRVVTDAGGKCTLFSKGPEDADYMEDDSYDLTPTTKDGAFMFVVKHTAGNNQNKFIDDLFIQSYTPIIEEPEEPVVYKPMVFAEQYGDTAVLLTFDQPVYAEEASFVLTELGETELIYHTKDNLQLLPVWLQGFTNGTTYTLSYSNLYYNNWQNVFEGEYTFTAVCEEKEEPVETKQFLPGAIRFNEVMANPNGLTALPQTEYIELQNLSGESIDMKGWTFMYADREVALTEYLFPDKHYLVLYREGREITVGEKGKAMPLSGFPALLANEGKNIKLIDPAGTLIDDFTYGKAQAGQAWERGEDGWHLSSDTKGGTPGAVNSMPGKEPGEPEEPEEPEEPTGELVEPFAVVFNELLPNPYMDEEEYIELYNRSGEEVSLAGLSVATRKSDGSLSTRYSLRGVPSLSAGGYILFTKSAESVFNSYTIYDPQSVYELKLPILNNEGSTLVLFRSSDGEVIDEVTYSPQWHDASIKEKKGVALERIHPDEPTQEADNWTSAAATAGYGTPGYQNSQYGKDKEGEISGIEKPTYSKETEQYNIRYYLTKGGYKCKALVYNLSGQAVAEISNNELLGTEGELIWNGKGNSGQRLTPGLYILYIELYHYNGDKKKFKEVFLVY
ncbi:lamin tail domain-containing protein [Parabacteroides sp. OttesenSCG-928-G06]|nr:lamin tail domain-containing protein [Parabacteroides sp. OttesenSCG-928-G06]